MNVIDAIYSIVAAADKNEVPHPNIISESGRALTAHHSVLVFNILEVAKTPNWEEGVRPIVESDHEFIKDLHNILKSLNKRTLMEHWHDTMQIREDALDLFSLGMITLEDRATIERLFWGIARECLVLGTDLKHTPDELKILNKRLDNKSNSPLPKCP